MFALAYDTVTSTARVLYYVAEYMVGCVFPNRKSIRDEVVLITGGGSGLGRLMALRLAELGAHVVVWDLNLAAAQSVAKEIEATGGKAAAYEVDVSQADTVYEMAQKTVEDMGNVNILINNAGVVTGRRLLDCSDEQIRATMDVNCTSHFWTTKAFLQAMLDVDHGHIVTIASVAGLVGTPGLVDYSASKFAAVGFDESLRNELALMGKTGIQTTCVCPYFINTGMFEGAQTKFPFLMPFLTPVDVANKIVDSILCNTQLLIMPRFFYINFWVRALLPTKAVDECSRFLGSQQTMEGFTGRQKPQQST